MPPTPLSSLQNPRIKLARSLVRRKEREASGCFLIEGSKLLQEALASGLQPNQVFATAAWWDTHEFPPGETEAFLVPPALLEALATTETPDGVVAIAPLPTPKRPRLGPSALVLIAHQLQDPGNLGTLIRAADAAGADAVVVTPGSTDPWSPKAVRSSMGSCFHLPILKQSLTEFRRDCPDLRLLALSLQGSSSLYLQNLSQGTAFLIGNEGSGLDAEAIALADAAIRIPIPGRAESLNAAMAATVCLYEAVRQRTTSDTI
ncbi:MAG: RNA methyltransferase [Candidatus Sericytochromatia bacterium]|nr:RNA methyltransferase [Candidatus Sericytochromatia bacterium]